MIKVRVIKRNHIKKILRNNKILLKYPSVLEVVLKNLLLLTKIKRVFIFKAAYKEVMRDIEKFFVSKTAKGKQPVFEHVEIETINKCNGTCAFCPVNRNDDPRPLKKMSDDTFYKIIDNLAKLNYCGQIGYYSNNEPLMDNRIYDFIKYGASKLPKARHNLFTNGTLLDCGKFQSLIDSGLNCLYIDNYNDKRKLNPNIQKIYDEYKDKEFPLNCEIYMRLNDEVLSNRGGAASNKRKLKKPLNASCYKPFMQLIIRADCGVSLCCDDALGKMTLGNVKEQTLEEIWYGQKHFDILKSMRKNVRNGICRECDIVSSDKHYNSFI